MHYLLYLKDKKEERGTDYDRPKLYHPRDNQTEEQINGSAAEYYHARGERNQKLRKQRYMHNGFNIRGC
jgi:predicted HNH restriction endonuclease